MLAWQNPLKVNSMARRPTIADLSRAAGVSVATVDRVLNRRVTVRDDTAQRVFQAADKLGFHATALLRHRVGATVPQRTFGFLLLKRADVFYQTLAAELEAATAASTAIRGRAVMAFMEELSPQAVIAALRDVGSRVDALAVVAVDHPHVAEAVAALRENGVPTLTLLTDLTADARLGYLGVDSRKAGRTAAWAIARTARVPGGVGILVGSHRFIGHELAESGFRSYFREHAPEFRVLEAVTNLEDQRIAYEATLDLMSRNPDLTGLYVAGGGMEGAIRALRDEAAGRQVALVCNELTADSRRALIDGIATMVLSTPLPLLASRAVDLLVRALAAPLPDVATQTLLPFEVHVSENI